MNITLKDVPPALHRKLKQRAQRNRRSLNGEVLTILERVSDDQPWPDTELLERIREVRAEMTGEISEELLKAARLKGRP